MKPIQLAGLAVMAVFYAAYFAKAQMQHRRGIRTNQMGRGSKPKEVLWVERLLAAATCLIVPVELASILLEGGSFGPAMGWAGIGVATVGVGFFVAAMLTMRDSWRAGIPAAATTELVTAGLYRFSRNPAFLGFDLMYLGLLAAFFNPIHGLFAAWAVLMLHLQILQEEYFLSAAFGEEYCSYKKRTGRYFTLLQFFTGCDKVS